MINQEHIQLLEELKSENEQVFRDSFLNLKLNEEAKRRSGLLDDIIEYLELSRTLYHTKLMNDEN